MDLIEHKERLQLPKFIINASADEFFPPDSSQFYYHQLQGPKWLRYLPNTRHYLGCEANINTTEIMASTFGALCFDDVPAMSWRQLDDGEVELLVNQKPDDVYAWFCHNLNARDFRKDTLRNNLPSYQRLELKPVSESPWVYRYIPEPMQKGWTAFFYRSIVC